MSCSYVLYISIVKCVPFQRNLTTIFKKHFFCCKLEIRRQQQLPSWVSESKTIRATRNNCRRLSLERAQYRKIQGDNLLLILVIYGSSPSVQLICRQNPYITCSILARPILHKSNHVLLLAIGAIIDRSDNVLVADKCLSFSIAE